MGSTLIVADSVSSERPKPLTEASGPGFPEPAETRGVPLPPALCLFPQPLMLHVQKVLPHIPPMRPSQPEGSVQRGTGSREPLPSTAGKLSLLSIPSQRPGFLCSTLPNTQELLNKSQLGGGLHDAGEMPSFLKDSADQGSQEPGTRPNQ